MERKMSDPEEFPQCNLCHQPMTRVWSSPTVVFNAPGFYSTDNKRG
jgi:predicted nucleic acid-binding Zn ribbon protein